METRTITLNAAQAKALNHWVGTFVWQHNLGADLVKPENAQYADMLENIFEAYRDLNPPKIRIAEEA